MEGDAVGPGVSLGSDPCLIEAATLNSLRCGVVFVAVHSCFHVSDVAGLPRNSPETARETSHVRLQTSIGGEGISMVYGAEAHRVVAALLRDLVA